ncbi:hypothetical protein H0H93_009307 [Arthromyces matolae]|nr:hypothetical protein H0H93_009307 [Arthromyces matolae]
MSTDTLLVPLSQLDHGSLEQVSVTNGYIVRSVNVTALQSAAIRVVNKWRLLAGRIVWSKNLCKWCILVPLKGDVSSRLKFTSTAEASRLPSSFVINESISAQVLGQRPPVKYFRHPSVLDDTASRASSRAPIISIHVTHFSNCACIGINFPHTVLDGFGIGQFIHALDDELHGRPWEAPPLPSEINVVQEALDDLEAAPSMFDDIHRESATYAGLRRDFTKPSFLNNFSNLRAVLSELIWGHIEDKTVYLNGKTLGKLLREVKDEVRTIDRGSVTTSDILVSWILKQQLAEKSVAELAILHRRGLEPMTHEAWIQAYNRFLRRGLGGTMLFRRGGRRDRDEPWMFTNQVIARADQIDFGSKMYAMWGYMTPIEVDHIIALNKFKDGYFIQGRARRSRWRAVVEAIQKLEPANLKTRL